MATYHYRFTYEDADGKQTGPSKVKSLTETGTATSMRLYNVPREDLLNITKRHIYRSTSTGASSPATSTFKLKSIITNNDWFSYIDNLASVSSGAAMPTATNFASGTTGAANIVTYGDDKVVITADNVSAVTVDDLKEYYKDNKCMKH